MSRPSAPLKTARFWRMALPCAWLLLAGCATDGAAPTPPGLELRFAHLGEGCQETTNGAGQVPDAITTLAVAIHGLEGGERIERTGRGGAADGSWLIKGIPVADDLDLTVYGCNDDGEVIYAGRSNGTYVEDGKETSLRAFLVPVGKVACTGDAAANSSAGESDHLGAGRSLMAAAALANGDVFVSGGVGQWDGQNSGGVSSRETWIYDHRSGHFRTGPQLRAARAWHHALPLGGGKILVVGGVGSLAAFASGNDAPALTPTDPAKALPAEAAELIDLGGPDRAASASASPANPGAGAAMLSSAVRAGDSLVFVGGMDDSGAALDTGTRLRDLTDLAAGGAGESAKLTLTTARVRPGLLVLDDGKVIVWGGNLSANAEDLGGRLDPDGDTVKKLKIAGDKGLLESATLATVGPAVALLSQTDSEVRFLVVGGMPVSSPLAATDAPAYIVTLSRSTWEAQLSPVTAGGEALHAGLGASLTRNHAGQLLLAGGLVALSDSAPCPQGSAECLLSQALLLAAPAADAAVPTDLTVLADMDLGQGQFGVTGFPLPAGTLLAGGQAAAVDTPEGDVLRAAGRVVVGPVDAERAAAVCGK